MEIDFSPIKPYDFQWECYDATVEHIKTSTEPAFIYASVSAGKTIMQSMLAKRAQVMAETTGKQQLKILFLARTGELVEQTTDEMWGMKARCSIFSQSLKRKSTKYNTIVGSERTVFNALEAQLKDLKFADN